MSVIPLFFLLVIAFPPPPRWSRRLFRRAPAGGCPPPRRPFFLFSFQEALPMAGIPFPFGSYRRATLVGGLFLFIRVSESPGTRQVPFFRSAT